MQGALLGPVCSNGRLTVEVAQEGHSQRIVIVAFGMRPHHTPAAALEHSAVPSDQEAGGVPGGRTLVTPAVGLAGLLCEATHLYPMSSKFFSVLWYRWMFFTRLLPSSRLELVSVSVWWTTTRWTMPFRDSFLAGAASHSSLEMMVTERQSK